MVNSKQTFLYKNNSNNDIEFEGYMKSKTENQPKKPLEDKNAEEQWPECLVLLGRNLSS